MKIAVLTKEFPPYVYGGAGVHVDHLTREMAKLEGGCHEIHILCFGNQKEHVSNRRVTGIDVGLPITAHDVRHEKLVDTLFRDAAMVGVLKDADLIHCHTWYTHLAGCLLRKTLEIPLVLTTHSLELQRPWKKEQLGTAYYASSWLEKTTYQNADGVIAVSGSMKQAVHDLYRVPPEKIVLIYNGIDTEKFRPTQDPARLSPYGIDPGRPYVLMVSRITRQKGITHFLEAVKYLKAGIQVVLCAAVADTDDILHEVSEKVNGLEMNGKRIIWVRESVPAEDLTAIYSQAAVFVCPSLYEPFGIINLEAMACGTPVVASRVGGIPEVVLDGQTGLLVPLQSVDARNPEPAKPDLFARDLAAAIMALLNKPESMKAMGSKARGHVEEHFSWKAIARQTLDFYKQIKIKSK